MSQTKVKKLTPAQEAQIPVYRDKWRARSLSICPIERSQAAETIKVGYRAMDGAPLRYGIHSIGYHFVRSNLSRTSSH
ncbi:hypothetical protein QUB63_03160 [Microcoleus sp. ARI1-B5]|uniref:hypothetical protein n=1 Tax=unclassified Microcoleus TaxID=2642155 RepID=UPI002FCF2555